MAKFRVCNILNLNKKKPENNSPALLFIVAKYHFLVFVLTDVFK
jgi:hypothetical protein